MIDSQQILYHGCNDNLERATIYYAELFEQQRLKSDVFA